MRLKGLGDELIHQPLLGRPRGPASWGVTLVRSVAMENPGVGIVFEVGAEAFVDHALSQGFLQDRKCDFDTTKEITIHPVGAGEKDSVVAVVQEIKDPAVFKKAPDNGTYSDMLRETHDAGP